VRYGLGVPSFGEHPNGDYGLYFFAWLAFASDSVDLATQEFGLLFLREFLFFVIAVRFVLSVCFFLGFTSLFRF
jgi:hypothetical protein